MNRQRVAALLRELADELERDDVVAVDRDPKPANDAPPRRARPPSPPAPLPPDDIIRKRAAQDLARLGYRRSRPR